MSMNYVCAMPMEVKKTMSDSLEQELYMVTGHCVDAGNQT